MAESSPSDKVWHTSYTLIVRAAAVRKMLCRVNWREKLFMVVGFFFFLFLFSSDRLIGLPEGRARNHNRPQQVPALSGNHIQDVAVGAEHTLVLSSTGDVYAWGSNSEGQVAIDKCQIVPVLSESHSFV